MIYIFDYIIRAESEAAAIDLLPEYYEGGAWRGDICLPNQEAYTLSGEERIKLPGWYMTIMRDYSFDSRLRNLPGNALRIIADRESAVQGKPFLVYVAPDVTMEMLDQMRIEPVPLGSNYPFGAAL